MADIELVIKISEEKYKDIQSRDWKNGGRWFNEEWKAIHNGTPLQKGHGRLIDADELDYICGWYHTDDDGSWCYKCEDIRKASIIIEADKERSE